jgi:hypothetical protein
VNVGAKNVSRIRFVELCNGSVERSGRPDGLTVGNQQQGFLARHGLIAEFIQFSAAEQQFGRREEVEIHVRFHKNLFYHCF